MDEDEKTEDKPKVTFEVEEVEPEVRNGAFIENIGFYDPMKDPPEVRLDEEKALLWLRRGAQPSEPVARILTKLNVMERVKAHEGTH